MSRVAYLGRAVSKAPALEHVVGEEQQLAGVRQEEQRANGRGNWRLRPRSPHEHFACKKKKTPAVSWRALKWRDERGRRRFGGNRRRARSRRCVSEEELGRCKREARGEGVAIGEAKQNRLEQRTEAGEHSLRPLQRLQLESAAPAEEPNGAVRAANHRQRAGLSSEEGV